MKAYAAAMVAAQRDMPSIAKDASAEVVTKTGGKYSYGYATLDGILEKVLPVLNAHGLALSQSLGFNEHGYALTTSLVHESGESVHSVTRLPVDAGTSPQALGSAVTYMRRYAILSVLALAPGDDDDGAIAESAPRSSARTQEQRVADPTAAGSATPKQIEDHDKLLKQLAVIRKNDHDDENPWDEVKQYVLETYNASSRRDLTVEEMDAVKRRTQQMIDEKELPFA